MKRAFTIAILLFALGSGIYVLTGGGATSAPPLSDTAPAPSAPAKLLVYYFDMGKDCSTCLNLESYTRETLETHFPDGLASGAIQWKVVDVDLPEHEHFVEEFGLYTKSVVLATMEGGLVVQHNNLSRIWELVYDKAAFMDYVRQQVDEALGVTP